MHPTTSGRQQVRISYSIQSESENEECEYLRLRFSIMLHGLPAVWGTIDNVLMLIY